MLNELKLEEFSKLKNGRNWERVLAGDSVEIQRLPYTTSTTPEILRGIVLGKVNRQSDTSLTMINVSFLSLSCIYLQLSCSCQVEHGTPVLRRIVMYNPLIQSVKVLQTAFIHEGKKRVRRSKIYYLQNRDPEFFTVPQ